MLFVVTHVYLYEYYFKMKFSERRCHHWHVLFMSSRNLKKRVRTILFQNSLAHILKWIQNLAQRIKYHSLIMTPKVREILSLSVLWVWSLEVENLMESLTHHFLKKGITITGAGRGGSPLDSRIYSLCPSSRWYHNIRYNHWWSFYQWVFRNL